VTDPVSPRPVVFGEVLFDTFPDGTAVLGGAPFNVAWHLHGFGAAPRFISRIGDDTHGARICEAMQAWGMDRDGLQRDLDHPTGTVRVELHGDGGHSFAILPDQAYDYIDPAAAHHALPADAGLLYHGSLIRRGASAKALDALAASGLPRFVDVNLRAPWWQADALLGVVAGARWVKLNDEELLALGGAGSLEAVAERFRADHGIELLIVTRGAEGALFVGAEGREAERPQAAAEVVDTVGAGDAFAAVSLLGLLRGWAPATIIGRALAFAADICGIRGATVADPALYRRHLESWGAGP